MVRRTDGIRKVKNDADEKRVEREFGKGKYDARDRCKRRIIEAD